MTGMIALATFVLATTAYVSTVGSLKESLDRSLVNEADAFARALSAPESDEDIAEKTREYMTSRTGGARGGIAPILVVRLASGRIISNSALRIETAGATMASSPSDPRSFDVAYAGQKFRAYAAPVTVSGKQVATFEAFLSTAPAYRTAAGVSLALAVAALISLGFVLPLSYLATRRSLAPLTEMAADARNVTHLRQNARIDYDGPDDELGSLAESLNDMLGRLETAFDDQRRFVADASHELRTPVAVIRGNVELLRSGRTPESERDESLEMIERESVRMSALLDELLEMARLESASRERFQPLEVATMLDEAIARGRSLAKREFARTGKCDLWVSGDPDLLDRVLANLVRNAVAHTHEGGHIELSCDRTDSSIRIAVSDDGVGIPDEDLERVFDRFYRAKTQSRSAEGGGAGLGLAITKRLVELHGGTISASAQSPHGARFEIELPAIQAPEDVD